MYKIQGSRSALLGLKTLFHHGALAAPGGSRVAGVMQAGDV